MPDSVIQLDQQIDNLPEITVPDLQNTEDTAGQIQSTVDTILGSSQELPALEGLTERREELEAGQTGLLNKIGEQFIRLAGRGRAQLRAERQQNVPELTQDVTNIRNRIITTQNRFARAREDVQRQEGLTAEQKNARIEELGRVQAREAADLAIIQTVKLNDLATAQDLADRKVKLEFEAEEKILEAQKFFFQENKELFNKADQREWEQASKERDREFDIRKSEFERLEKLKINFASNAAQNGAPDSVVESILASSSPDNIIRAGGQYIDRLDRELKTAQIQKIFNEINETEDNPSIADIQAGLLAAGQADVDPVIVKMMASKGGEALVASQTESILQMQSALAGVESLNALLALEIDPRTGKRVRDGLSLTGPVTGRARKLLNLLGADASASQINSTIQGLVPTVARGIFNEVGVLTDADIRNYTKTLPNLTSTEQQNRLISVVMMDVLSQRMKNSMDVWAVSGRDVSGFVPSYMDIRNRVQQEREDLGISFVETGQERIDDETLAQNVVGGGSTVSSGLDFFNIF